MRDIEKICPTCRYWCYENIVQGHVCVNPKSEHIADWTEEDDACDFWMGVGLENCTDEKI